ncbi:uncharacterized protein LOC120636416 [Pararge aegeria]|uniref:uncharacterized protein LOC120636416 n=1 Tax=Pararge aegeria TaxID=116150 RepID=UPI0019CF902C|nr:uncharacterized protein LOC120636416 [Pararge aegeria]
MPKRMFKDSEVDYINYKIRKLERKLDVLRTRRESSTSSSSSESLILQYNKGEEIVVCSRPPSPIEEVEITTENAEMDIPHPEVPITSDDVAIINEVPEPVEVPTLENENLPDEIIEILGQDPTSISEYSSEIRKALADRLIHIATTGLDKEARKELFRNKKYFIPSNCKQIAAPLLNLEIKAALTEHVLKRDKGMEARQKQIASAISCFAQVMDLQIQNQADSKIIKDIMEGLRMLCDIQYTDSMKRRYFISSCLKKEVNDHLSQTKIDKYIFGKNVAETLKTAKIVSKSGTEIRVQDVNSKTVIKRKTQPQPSTSRGLNWKAPPARRQPAQTRSRPPVHAQKPDYSSKGSRQQQQQHQQRNTRRF